MEINEEKAENTPAGGVLVGKKDGQTIIHDKGTMSGYLVGKLHKDGGIKAVNKATGQPLEMQGGEIVITAPAVSDTTKREFEGKMMTNREILSKINSDGGGVSFADGGDIPAKIHTTDKEYEYGGKMVHDSDIAHSLGMNSTLKKGKQQFSSGDTTYDVDAIYNAIKKGKLRLKTKEVETFPMKYPVYDKHYAENHKIDFRKPNGITVRTESGEEVLIDGNHRMNNAYLKGRKTMKTYYIEDPKQIAKFTKKTRVLSDDYQNKMATATAKKDIRTHFNHRGDAFDDRKDSENWSKYSLPYDTRFDIEFKNGGHLSKGKSLKQIAEMHNVSLAHINEQLAKGLEVEKEHFADFKERTRVAKDHLVENPNYYTILEKAGLEDGGHLIHHRHSNNLVKDAKSGNTPARDLNNYNDLMDVQADGAVGGDSGIFADGGNINNADLSELLEMAKSGNYADGGLTPYDANQERDYFPVLSTGGGVEPIKVEKIIISQDLRRDKGYSRFVKKEFADFQNFKNALKELVEEEDEKIPNAVNNGGFLIRINEDSGDSPYFWFEFNNKQKNTVSKFNPSTGKVSDFEKQLKKKRPKVFNSLDWTDFFEGQKQTKKDNSVSRISITYDSRVGTKNGLSFKYNTLELYNFLRGLQIGSFENVKIQPIGNDLGVDSIPLNLNSSIWENILTKMPEESALKEINRFLYSFYSNLDFDAFVRETSNGSSSTAQTPTSTSSNNTGQGTTSTKTPLTKEELNRVKIWIGDDINLKEKVIQKLEEIGFPFDRNNGNPDADKNISIYTFTIDFVVFKENKEQFNVDQRNKEIFPEDLGIDVTTMGVAPTTSKSFDFTDTKINVEDNPDLSLKVQKKAFEDGWEWENGGGKTLDYDDFNYLYFTKTSISFGNTASSFNNSPKREITNSEIFGSQNTYGTPTSTSSNNTGQGTTSTKTPLTKEELKRVKIWIGDDINLKEKVIQKLEEIGFPFDRNNGTPDADKNIIIRTYTIDFVVFKENKEEFNRGRTHKEIFPEDLGIDVTTMGVAPTTSSTQSQYPEYYEYVEKSSSSFSKGKIYKIKNPKNLIEAGNFVDDTGVYNGHGHLNAQYFKPSTEEAFLAQQTPVSNTTTDKEVTSINMSYVVNANPTYYSGLSTGKGFIEAINSIENSNINYDVQVNISVQYKIKDNNGNLSSTFETQDEYIDFGKGAFRPSNWSVAEIKSIVANDWFDGKLDFDKFFSDIVSTALASKTPASQTPNIIEPYDAYRIVLNWKDNSGKGVVDTMDIFSGASGRFFIERLNEIEAQSQGKDVEVRITVFADDNGGNQFDRNDYFTIGENFFKPSTRTNEQIKSVTEEWIDGVNFDKYFEDVIPLSGSQTPTSTPVVPKTAGTIVSDLDEAVQKLEKASSKVATEYNTEVYDKSLKFLYDTKATYELALKFTPESAFMYERLEIMKKLADLEKNIKRIEDMKKGGAFYILAKILEKLQRGENWRTSENAQDVITNQLPQSEIDVIIRSHKFKNWFGNWEKALVNDEYDNVSKALTDGIPSVYHHGARRIKYTYREVSNGVLYLAENISYALWFSQNSTAQSEEGNYLTDCFVNIKNPIDLTAFHVNQIDLADLVRYIDAIYPLAKIYDFIPAQVALLIKTNQPTNIRMWAWQLIRKYAKFVNHIKENTPYDGFLYYENNPSDQVINPVTGQSEENVTKAVAIFKSHQVKVVDAVLFDGGLDDWRFENGGKINN